MQGDAVAFGIDDDGPVAVRADLVPGLHDLPAIRAHGFDRRIQPAIDGETRQFFGFNLV